MPLPYYFAPDQASTWFLVGFLVILFLTLWASARVNSTFRKYSQIRNTRGLTGAEAARTVLLANGITNVRIERIQGNLNDHFDPRSNVIRLSDGVYDAATPAAVGVAAHEAGHAVQYAVGYAPIKLRSALVRVTNLGSRLAVPLVVAGVLLSSLELFAGSSQIFYYISMAGIACYGLCVLFQLVTLPTEFDASRRAMAAIRESQLLTAEEQKGARSVLTAAAMTYVAALAASVYQLLRLLHIVNRNRD